MNKTIKKMHAKLGVVVISIALSQLIFSFDAQADIYKYVDPSTGQVTYTDEPQNSQYKLIIKSLIRFKKKRKKVSKRAIAAMNKNKKLFSPIIKSAAEKHRLDPKLLHAVIRAESAYNPKAVSHKGAVGLMQLMPETAVRFGVKDRKDPTENINGGAKYLSELLKLFESDIKLAVAAYNAGEQNVMKYGNKIPPFNETRQYVTKVMKFYGR